MRSIDVVTEARKLVTTIVLKCRNPEQEDDFFSIAVYDTAWLSMIRNENATHKSSWLFPECFEYLLDNQHANGGWESYISYVDGIINTLPSLLAMLKHREITENDVEETTLNSRDLHKRIDRAIAYLQKKFEHWDVQACHHVGFEILIPALLQSLSEYGILFEFPGRQTLETFNRQKLSKFNPRQIYEQKTSILHSLEALIGHIDFTKLSHHKTFGSMMASPSSTAAYLMNIDHWDIEAEHYLRKVVRCGGGNGKGGVPSAYPCLIFQTTWVVTTFLEAGFSVDELGQEGVEQLATFISELLEKQDGLLGFAPGVTVDADDTAKAILFLQQLGREVPLDPMLKFFSSKEGHFVTYIGERDPSISANCNVLMALLRSPDPSSYTSRISSVTKFLCDTWWKGTFSDKWNASPFYPMMLLAEVLSKLLHLWDLGKLNNLSETLLLEQLPVVLVQVLGRILLESQADSTDFQTKTLEEKSYAVLALKALKTIPWFEPLLPTIDSTLDILRHELRENFDSWQDPQHIWVEKVNYASRVLSQTYCIASLRMTREETTWGTRLKTLIPYSNRANLGLAKFFYKVHGMSSPLWKYELSVVEGQMFSPRLHAARSKIFPTRANAEDKYLAYIPSTWTIINNCSRLRLPSQLLWDMMEMSLLDYLVDEFMESRVAFLSESNLELVESFVRVSFTTQNSEGLIEQTIPRKRRHSSSHRELNYSAKESPLTPEPEDIKDIRNVLMRYIKFILNHSHVKNASEFDKIHLAQELRIFLLAHISQIQDNNRFGNQIVSDATDKQEHLVFKTPRSSYYNWAHTTAAEHTSCSVSFAFYACVLSCLPSAAESGLPLQDCFAAAREKYKARDLTMHLAVMSRMYNDFSSVHRDCREMNLNSVNFPEFQDSGNADLSTKDKVRQLAEYERSSARAAAQSLIADLTSSKTARGNDVKVNAITLFVEVTELYADMYVARDITNSVK